MSTNDNEIREFFRHNSPALPDEGTFIAGLSAKMDAVSGIKKLQDEANRQTHIACIIALLCGILAGGAIVAFVLIRPVSAPHFKISIIASVATFIQEWKSVLIALIAISSIILGIVPWGKKKTGTPF